MTGGHVYCYHYTTCTKPGKWAVKCIVTITLPVQSQENERSGVFLPLHELYKARTMSGLDTHDRPLTCLCTGNVMVTLHMTAHLPGFVQVVRYHSTTCTKPEKWAVMCIVTIKLPVKSQVNEWSCVWLPLHYLYKARKMSGHVYCYHYTTCTKPGRWPVMCIATITLPVQSQVNDQSWMVTIHMTAHLPGF
jgi:hypothetical protein